MANLNEINRDPATYLGTTGNAELDSESHALFAEAVELLIAEGLTEGEALDYVWNDGDFSLVADEVVRNRLPAQPA